MHHLHRAALTAEESFEMHETRYVAAREDLDAGRLMVGDSIPAHGARDRLFGGRKASAKSATLIGAFQRNHLDAIKALQKGPGLVVRFVAELAGRSQAQLAEA